MMQADTSSFRESEQLWHATKLTIDENYLLSYDKNTSKTVKDFS